MVRHAACRLLVRLVTTSTTSKPCLHHQSRSLNIHEYQGAALMTKFGVNVPKGVVVSSKGRVAKVLKEHFAKDTEVVVRSQVLAGGRGLGTFKNGLKEGVHIVKKEKVEEMAGKMLGQILVIKQTGAEGKPVSKVLLYQKLNLINEMYFAIVLDRVSAGPVMIACSKGSISREDLAEKYPKMITKVPVSIREGITDKGAEQVVKGLALKKADMKQGIDQIKKIYKLFTETDCTQVEGLVGPEFNHSCLYDDYQSKDSSIIRVITLKTLLINPLAETSTGTMMAADAKLNFDDNAGFRQKEIFAMRDTTQEDPREVAASNVELNYIGLDGEIGCMVNGAGLAMATMDIFKLSGGTPANFLDVGGNATDQEVVEAFKILTVDARVKAILVNIFGGIMKCDVIAAGIVAAAKQVKLKVPLVVRLEGTNVNVGKTILKESQMTIITADDLGDAAKKAVKALKKK